MSARGRCVLVAGATSASGDAAVRALRAAGATVVAVGRDAARLGPLGALGARTAVCDLTDEAAVAALSAALRADGVRVDGILHLVGGWRGGGGIAGQSEADYRALEGGLTALRLVTRAFWDDLVAAPAARTAIVSSTAVARPLAGGANYAAVKAAEEAWARAMAQGFAKATDAGGESADAGGSATALRAASVIFRVRTLAGLEDALAAAFVGLWDAEASAVNDRIITLGA
ncbi:SDR family oxidoreductase [Microbacterium sp.]|uniref:SDR family oxidoreductase n=1 Tax=Microbacterium sp. TaxID=51671 RepID=UPI002898A706|nr:SDR family oxidoreductase [Microbacterium sp.]